MIFILEMLRMNQLYEENTEEFVNSPDGDESKLFHLDGHIMRMRDNNVDRVLEYNIQYD